MQNSPATQADSVCNQYSVGAGRVLFLMFLLNVVNYLDRMLFAILQEPIKHELDLTDTQLGLLGGPAFAILYSLMALPLGRVADGKGRTRVITAVLTLWSVMTALCGGATTFVHLFLARMGVSVGEAGCVPSAHSLLSDYFPSTRRAGAISIFQAGTSIGTLLAGFGGGAIAHAYGWRITFFACGLLGLGLAAAILLLVHEPARPARRNGSTPSLMQAVRLLRAKRSFLHLVGAMSLATLSGFAAIQYLTSFLMRAHGLPITEAAAIMASMAGGVGFFATAGAGLAVDRMRHRYPRAQMIVPAIAVPIAAGAFWIAFLAPSLMIAIPALAVAIIGLQSFLGPGFALAQSIAPPAIRSTTAALLMLVIGMVGFALGAPLVGIISDFVARHDLRGTGLNLNDCPALVGNLRCAAAQVHGLRLGLIFVTLPMLWSGVHFWLASRSMIADIDSSSVIAIA